MRLRVKFLLILIAVLCIAGITVTADENSSSMVVVVDNDEVIAESILSEFSKSQYDGMVTEVFSINNTLTNCYYKPYRDEVPYLEESVLRRGFINAYTGYFDLDNTGEYVPEEYSSRAVEVLGSDFLIMSESYDKGIYSVTKIPESAVSGKAAIMSIYKAIGLPQYELTYYASEVSKEQLRQSPAILNLPSFVKDVNPKYGKMRVFITRTNPDLYIGKAQREMYMSNDLCSDRTITSGEFIVLVRNMMDFYGEARMSDQEMNAVMQAYGGNIPQYLTENQKDAYLYLKARGILNDDTIDFSQPLTLRQMLDILMCVKDENSRSDFKQIQLTMSISDGLQSAGYFPKKVILSDSSDALQIDEEYDYSDAQAYDYYVEQTEQTTFKDTKGNILSDMFIPSIPADPASVGIDGFQYAGIEVDESGKKYYHYIIPIISEDSDYMKKSTMFMGEPGWIQINTLHNSDKPAYIWLKQGGGVYTYESTDSEKGVNVTRRPFKDNEFEGSASEERKAQSSSLSAKSSDWFFCAVGRITDILFGNEITAKAAVTNSGTKVRVTIYQTHNISNREKLEALPYVENPIFDADNDVFRVTVPAASYSIFLASIRRDESLLVNKSYDGIANIFGDTLLNFADLADRGILFYDANGNLPQPTTTDPDILVLDSINGRIILNNRLKQVVVGSTIYQINNASHQLFETTIDANGIATLCVDFRVAYGWSSNVMDIEVTGTGDSYNVSIATLDSSLTYAPVVSTAKITPPPTFQSNNSTEFGYVLNKGVIGNSDYKEYLTTSGYALSNWMIYQGQNGDYAFVYYLKDVFDNMGLEPPDDKEVMESIVGYSVVSAKWVIRVVPLTKTVSTVPGQFSYVEPFGYIYNLPTEKDFSLDKYLSGEYILPLATYSVSSTNYDLYNYNVNLFGGYPYGTRPDNLVNVPGGSTYLGKDWIDVKGNKGELDKTPASGLVVEATPAGIQSTFGGYKRKSFKLGEGTTIIDSANISDSSIIYLGTTPLIIDTAGLTNGKKTVSAFLSIGTDFSKEIYLSTDLEFYQIAKWKDSGGGTYYRYVTWDNITEKHIAEEPTDDAKAQVTITDAERQDVYQGMDKFSFEYVLAMLDSTTSWVILFCFEVLPYVGIILLTVLLGLSFISSIKVVQAIVRKTFDPVKMITLGKLTFEELNRPKMILGLVIGYCMFALLLDGNLIRLLVWGSKAFSVFATLLRQL